MSSCSLGYVSADLRPFACCVVDVVSSVCVCRLGIQSACLSQGVFEATGRRYVVTWRMLNEVMIISIVPSGTSILTAHRASRAVAQLLLIYCKSTTAVTMDRLFKKYVQVGHDALAATVVPIALLKAVQCYRPCFRAQSCSNAFTSKQ